MEFPLEEEYKKKTGITPEDIKKLREWLKTQPHLPEEHITDMELILAYHCCSRSAEVAKQLLDLHFTLKTLLTSFFKDRYFDDRMRNVLENVVLVTPMPRSPEGYAVSYTSFLDPKKFVLADCFRVGLMVNDLSQREEGTWPGVMLLIDFQNFTLTHLSKFEPHCLQQIMYYLQDGLLLKLKGIHVLNAPSFIDRVMMFLRPFFKNELLSMLHIHQVGSRTLDKFYPIEHLPPTAGGKGPSVEELQKAVISRMEAGKDYFAEENKKRVVESRRPGMPKTISDIFGGVEGSFKKLDID